MEYKHPTLEVLKIKITQMEDEILKVSVIENLKDAWRNIEATDLEFVKGETLDFCKESGYQKLHYGIGRFIRTEKV